VRQVHDLLDRGTGLLECSRRLGLSLNTVKRYARAAEPGRMIRAPKYRATLVDPYRDHLRARRAEDPAVDLPNVHAFTRGLGLDIDDAIAAVTLPFHNGRTEGVNTKTKMIKRQMYGRAGFTLLRHRILLS
jgi:transposase